MFMEKKYNYLYKITNLINGKFYYGIHSTDNLNDGYMGSGSYLNNAYKKHGIENFQKEILEFRDTREEISDLEKEIVTEELINNPDCYNIKLGGDDGTTLGTATMRDENGNTKRVVIGSDEYNNMTGATIGRIAVFDKKEQKYVSIFKDDYEKDKNRYEFCSKGLTTIYNKKEQKYVSITTEEYYKHPDKYQTPTSGKVTVLIDGEYKHIPCEEYNKGNYQTVWSGKHHSEETKRKMSNSAKERDITGDKNPSFGTCWITKDGKNKKIKKEELDVYLNDGWNKGRKTFNCWINNGIENKQINLSELDFYLKSSWKRGVICHRPKQDKLNPNDIQQDIDNGLSYQEMCYKYDIGSTLLSKYIRRCGLIQKRGKCWINNGIENKHISNDKLDEYLNNGWDKGKFKIT